jgi:hypothetical protein
VHPMQGDEIRALRRLQREQQASPYVFTSERGGPMSAKSFGTLFERLGRRAGTEFKLGKPGSVATRSRQAATKPEPTGSGTCTKTIGTVRVAPAPASLLPTWPE